MKLKTQNAKLRQENKRDSTFCTLHFTLCTSAGFTLVELLVSIAILATLGAFSINTFVDLSQTNMVQGNTEAVISQLRQAQSQTLSLLDGNQYGVHLTSTSSTLFAGSTYQSGNASNIVFSFGTSVMASATPSDYIFQTLSGTTTSGTIKVYASSNQAIIRTISVAATGVAEIQ